MKLTEQNKAILKKLAERSQKTPEQVLNYLIQVAGKGLNVG